MRKKEKVSLTSWWLKVAVFSAAISSMCHFNFFSNNIKKNKNVIKELQFRMFSHAGDHISQKLVLREIVLVK
jgi:hypothetical protein